MSETDRVRVAIIDDHELMRQGLRAVLESDPGIEIAYDGMDPAAAADSASHVAVLDIDLGPAGPPVGENIQVLRAAGTRVLLISAFEDAAVVRAGISAGALGFIPKRQSVTDLVAAISTVAAGKLCMSVEMASILASAPAPAALEADELEALRLYAAGFPLEAVGQAMGIDGGDAAALIESVREKYTPDS